jgi:hypothetical protein
MEVMSKSVPIYKGDSSGLVVDVSIVGGCANNNRRTYRYQVTSQHPRRGSL